jgi:peptide/nickel transport system substrate-binding protein
MKNKVIWLGLSFLLVAAMLLASCGKSSTTETTSTAIQTSTITTTTSLPTSTPTSTSSSTVSTTTTTSSTGNWWDSLGKPQYGGQMVERNVATVTGFDPWYNQGYSTFSMAWFEQMHAPIWTLDPLTFDYKEILRPSDYIGPYLTDSWEMPDTNTYIVKIHKGVTWQNLPPVNGRAFVANDIVMHFSRMFGLGNGFTAKDPYQPATPWGDLVSVTAPDTSTVVFTWKNENPENIAETLQGQTAVANIEAPEAVTLWGNLQDWHHAVGTGPFILTDFVDGSSATLVKNPYYWGYDARFPQNQLPYVASLKILIIPDTNITMAAMRTGKIDIMDAVALIDAQNMQKSNPDIKQVPVPNSNCFSITPRNDTAPFTDIRVRQALQMAIDLPTIAATYYSNTIPQPWPQGITSSYMSGWGFPYPQWPQDLKDQYAYNVSGAKALLAAAGFPSGFNTSCVANSTADLTLLQIVQSYFAAINVNMSITTLSNADFSSTVVTGHKQTALAYNSAGVIGRTFGFITELTIFQTGYIQNFAMTTDTKFDAFYTQAITATTQDQVKSIIKEANKYGLYQHYVVSLLQPTVYSINQPWLHGYNGQYGAVGNGVGVGFYGARFWLDSH